MIYLALYRGRKTLRRPYDLIARTADGLTRILTRGPYSHCEIALLSGSPNAAPTESLSNTEARCPNAEEHSGSGYLKAEADCLKEGKGCLKADDLAANATGCLKDNKTGGTVGQSAEDGRLYRCYSASIRDGGVRCKTMPLPADKWDLIPISSRESLALDLQAHYAATHGQAYDWRGALGIVLPTRQHSGKWFCSEWCGRVLGLPESWRFSPNDLAAIVRRGQMPKEAAP